MLRVHHGLLQKEEETFSDHRGCYRSQHCVWRLLKERKAMSKKGKGNEQVEKQVDVKKKKVSLERWFSK